MSLYDDITALYRRLEAARRAEECEASELYHAFRRRRLCAHDRPGGYHVHQLEPGEMCEVDDQARRTWIFGDALDTIDTAPLPIDTRPRVELPPILPRLADEYRRRAADVADVEARQRAATQRVMEPYKP